MIDVASLAPAGTVSVDAVPVVRQRFRQLGSEDKAELVRRYLEGETLQAIAEDFRVNRKTVSAILKREGVGTRYRKLSESDVERATVLYEDGRSLADVASELGVDAGTIRNRLMHRGVLMRPVGTNQWS